MLCIMFKIYVFFKQRKLHNFIYWYNLAFFLQYIGCIFPENKTEAVLYYNEGEFDICVNALIVEEGLASSSGPEYVYNIQLLIA